MGELSNDSDYLTATARDTDPETEATSYFSAVEVEEQIEQSKVHWSLLSESRGSSREGEEEEVAEVSNARVFKDLEAHPSWGRFFRRQDECAEFVVGEKFAAGAQAELYHVRVTSPDPESNEENRRDGTEWVVKVFRKGTFLRDLQLQVPTGYLDFRAQIQNVDDETLIPRFQSDVVSGILLDDGRFAFLMAKEHFDLRLHLGWIGCIATTLFTETSRHQMCLSENTKAALQSTNVMWQIMSALWELLAQGFLGLLRYCKDGKLEEILEVFSKAADVYAYGMVYYEALTGKLPFEGHCTSDYDFVLNGQRPMVPKSVEGWKCELLKRCWQSNPGDRPSFGEILDLLLANSKAIREFDEYMKTKWGENYRTWGHIENLD